LANTAETKSGPTLCVFRGDALATYNFGATHPFGPRRYHAFLEEFERRGLDRRVKLGEPELAGRAIIELFHEPGYVRFVMDASASGEGYLDYGDTPSFPGVFEAAATVVGTVITAIDAVMGASCRQAFIPIAGLHHARRDRAGGFCVFNDCGVAIEYLRSRHGIERIAYVDIDAHHADGVFYSFEDDPHLFLVDFHEDGRYLYPGTGFAEETGKDAAEGTKQNFPMPPGSTDPEFFAAWEKAEAFIDACRPEFVLFQCGADSIMADPITHLAYTTAVHRHVAGQLREIADRHAGGRLVALGGGGYDPGNLATAWCEVISGLIAAEPTAASGNLQ
jgi:acetoin utilization protein AcuC